MDIISIISSIPGIGPYLPYVFVVFGICAVIMTVLPAPASTTTPYGMLYWLINLLAQNYGRAKNASAPPATPPGSGATKAAIVAFLLGSTALTSCSTAEIAQTQADLTKFCSTDQPVIGTIATVAADGTAAVDPSFAPGATVVGMIVAAVNGACPAGALSVPTPAAGTKVVVPAAATSP